MKISFFLLAALFLFAGAEAQPIDLNIIKGKWQLVILQTSDGIYYNSLTDSLNASDESELFASLPKEMLKNKELKNQMLEMSKLDFKQKMKSSALTVNSNGISVLTSFLNGGEKLSMVFSEKGRAFILKSSTGKAGTNKTIPVSFDKNLLILRREDLSPSVTLGYQQQSD